MNGCWHSSHSSARVRASWLRHKYLSDPCHLQRQMMIDFDQNCEHLSLARFIRRLLILQQSATHALQEGCWSARLRFLDLACILRHRQRFFLQALEGSRWNVQSGAFSKELRVYSQANMATHSQVHRQAVHHFMDNVWQCIVSTCLDCCQFVRQFEVT